MARLTPTRIALAAAVACYGSAALADPFTLVAVAAGAAGVAGVIAPLTAFAIGVGASMLGGAQARRKQRAQMEAQRQAQISSYNASLQDRNVTVLNNEAGWKIVYGSPAPVGGSVVAILTSGDKDQYKHLVVVFAAHECQAIDEIYIEGEAVGVLDADGWCTAGPFSEVQPGETITETIQLDGSGTGTLSRTPSSLLSVTRFFYQDEPATLSGATVSAPSAAGSVVQVSYTYSPSTPRVNVQKHLSPGGVDTADAFLRARVPGSWTSAHKLSGFTYAVVTLDLNLAKFQGGPPNITAKLRGKKVYDWRTATTAYSNNPALCTADYLMGEYGFGAGLAQIESAAAQAAANACDSQGYTCDGVVATEQSRDSNLTMLEDSMAGSTHFSGGVWRIMAGAWASPVMTLEDSTTLAAPIEVMQAGNAREARFNTVRGRYVPAAGLGVTADMTPYTVSAYVTADGDEQALDLSLPMTPTMAQCQKLASIALERSRLGLTIRYPAQLRAWKLQPGDRVAVNNAEFGFVAKTFRVVDWDFAPNAPVGLVLTEDLAAAWTGTFTGVDPQLATSNLVDPFAKPAAPTPLLASSGTDVLQIASDGTIVTRVLATWNPTTNRAVLQGGYAQLQWRLANATDDVWTSQDLPGDASSAYLIGPQDGSVILIRVRYVTGVPIGAKGNWATIAHTVTGKTEPPSDVAEFYIDGDALRWTEVDDLDLAGYRIRFNYGNNPFWGSGAPLHDGLLTTSPYTMASRPAGVVTLLIKAVDTTGNESENAARIVTNLGDVEVSNILLSYAQAPTFAGTITNGAVSGGTLQASNTDLFYGDDEQPFYGADTDPFYATGTFAQMQYAFTVTPSAEGTLVLQHTITASDYTIEYSRDSQAAFYGADSDLFYGADTEPFYGEPGSWQTWPGSIELSAPEAISFRITTAGGPTQGVIATVTAVLDVPDVTEELEDEVISSAGTRLPITQTYRVIENVLLTLQNDGNGGASVRIEDKNATLGPLVKVLNTAGVAVNGLVDARIKGY